MPSLNTVHRMVAVPILTFIALHLFNHIVSIAGVDSHIVVMNSLRVLYRNLIVESIILFSLLAQIIIGLYFVFRSRNRRYGFFQKTQAFSGLYIAFFLVFHIGAVFNGRYNLDLDTNFYFAAAGLHVGWLKLFFIPYYLFAVIAVFTHVACFIHWRIIQNSSISKANIAAALIIFSGIVFGFLIVASLSGMFYDVNIPNDYKNMF